MNEIQKKATVLLLSNGSRPCVLGDTLSDRELREEWRRLRVTYGFQMRFACWRRLVTSPTK